jgi:dihydrofolate reductase
MRKVTYGGATSLDNYLAGPGEAIDWLRWSDDSAKLAAESFPGVDTMLMGRKTFEFARRMGGGPVPKGVTTYVFSRTMEALPEGAAGELVSEDVADFVRRIREEPGGGILAMGGGEIGSALLEAGLVDEIGFSVHPVLLGGGIPAFLPFGRRIELEPIEARAIARECVLLRYRVKQEGGGGEDADARGSGRG